MQSSEQKVVLCRIIQENYGIPVNQVQSIERMRPITPIPHAPGYIKGMIHLRDKVIPVVDLQYYFRGVPFVEQEGSRIVIVQEGGEPVGLLVDEASDVLDISNDWIQEIYYMGGKKNDMLKIVKMAQMLFILVDAEKLIKELNTNDGLREYVEELAKEIG